MVPFTLFVPLRKASNPKPTRKINPYESPADPALFPSPPISYPFPLSPPAFTSTSQVYAYSSSMPPTPPPLISSVLSLHGQLLLSSRPGFLSIPSSLPTISSSRGNPLLSVHLMPALLSRYRDYPPPTHTHTHTHTHLSLPL